MSEKTHLTIESEYFTEHALYLGDKLVTLNIDEILHNTNNCNCNTIVINVEDEDINDLLTPFDSLKKTLKYYGII